MNTQRGYGRWESGARSVGPLVPSLDRASPASGSTAAAVLVFAASIALWLVLSTHPSLIGTRLATYFDLNVYRGGAESVLHGRSLYGTLIGRSHFTYPPLAALLFAPLTLMPFWADKVLVSAINCGALFVMLRCALRLEPVAGWLDPRARTRLALLAAAGALWLEPVLTTLGFGQIDLVIAALVVSDLSLGDHARAKGVMIGIAAGLKLTPIIFILYLLLTRRWQAGSCALISFAMTIAAGLAILPGDALRYWGGLFADTSRVGRLQNTTNQSLYGGLARLLHTVQVQTPWLLLAVIVGVAGLALAVLASRFGDEATGFSFCALAGLLLSPVSWTHHWVIAVPALLLLGVTAWRTRSSAGLIATATLAVVGFTHNAWSIPPAQELHLGPLALLYADAYVLSALVALAAGGLGYWGRLRKLTGRNRAAP